MTSKRELGNVGAPPDKSAFELAEASYLWYAQAAIRSRRMSRLADLVTLAVAPGIIGAVAVWPEQTYLPAILGLFVSLASGAAGIYKWRENYIRFSTAREALNRELRSYRFGVAPYDERSDRDQRLVARLNLIEHAEIASWAQVTEIPKSLEPQSRADV